MPRKPPEETPPAEAPPPEQPRRRRARHSADDPLTYEIIGAGRERGPKYTINNASRAVGPPDGVTIRRVRN